MINHLNGMNAWDNLVYMSIYLCFMHKKTPGWGMGVQNHFAKPWRGAKIFSMFKMGHDIFSNCANYPGLKVTVPLLYRILTALILEFILPLHVLTL